MDRVIFVLYILMALKIAGVFIYVLFTAMKENYKDILQADREGFTEPIAELQSR